MIEIVQETIKGVTMPDIRCTEGLFKTQTNADFYVKKRYGPDSTHEYLQYFWISHTKTRECINIFYCTQDEFIHFFGVLNEPDIMLVQRFFKDRDAGSRPSITTDGIYLIIELAKKYLSTNVVNIVDESCNYIPCGVYDDSNEDIGVRCMYGNDQIDKILRKLPPNTKYGGKTTRKRKQKICI